MVIVSNDGYCYRIDADEPRPVVRADIGGGQCWIIIIDNDQLQTIVLNDEQTEQIATTLTEHRKAKKAKGEPCTTKLDEW